MTPQIKAETTAETLELELRTHRPAGWPDLPESWILPRYDGLSVGNLAATSARALGATLTAALPPLRADLLGDLTAGVERVVLVVIDALGWLQLQRAMARYPDLVFHKLAESGRLLPITTAFASTTTSVLNTIWSGQPPIRHGVLAYEMFLREWLMAVESISFSTTHEPFGSRLLDWGFEPEKFVPTPTLGMQLAGQGLGSYALTFKDFVETPLALMNYRGAREVYGYAHASDFWVSLRRMLRERAGERCFIGAYWSAVDTLGHMYGPLDETGEAEICSIAHLFETFFLDKLSASARERTLFLLTADHGQITTSSEVGFLLDDHPELRDALFLPPLGEARVPFFYVRHGAYDRVWAYLHEHFGEHFVFLSRAEVIERGLLGPDGGKMHTEAPHRLGDIVGIARREAFLTRDPERLEKALRGQHGGLTAEEMMIPLLAARLDA
ncbi:MAG: alkaline phosphatase family protein [Anaerolineales bacterium]